MENNNYNIPRMRTITKAFEEVKSIDPETSLTMRALRRLIKSGNIPSVQVGNKNLINMDLLFKYLMCYNDNAANAVSVS